MHDFAADYFVTNEISRFQSLKWTGKNAADRTELFVVLVSPSHRGTLKF